ncbi:GLPGLI family protein [Winogradskyella undariae]|uniref:GLPGLI family protein n=1 Tax=Winogradskyella TaxID=286104 RepID=UPI00156B573C|nr:MULTISPECIES: GLPGLI family protein [Winogradskyella]NRR92197.1 GLPGLI family protein [Winogradskyella undariae]QNK77239.1 GLPGLI family protein [Winogradskyella sp. PAMC22761]QXP80203.1 GLPGLI family protein [Winogradskyella sp. HaHa_3_26]
MSKYLLIFFFFFNCFISLFPNDIFSIEEDNIEIEYTINLIDEVDDYGSILFYRGLLKSDGNDSEFRFTLKDTIFESELLGSFEINSNNFKKFFYKNLENSVVYYKEKRGLKNPIIIKDNVKINWNLSNETKIINGAKCYKAYCTFRGRDYEAFYDKSIPFKDGPFKFSGLPGLILEINSLDGSVKMKASLITYTFEETPVNPYKGLVDVSSFSDYKKSYIKYFKKMTGYKSDLDSEVFVPKRYIEYLVDE